MSELTDEYLPPVAVGGVGGSGTRLVAQCLREAGFFIGSDLNGAYDNLWFTLLFKRIEILNSTEYEFKELVDIFFKGMNGSRKFTATQIHLINELASLDREQHPATWLKERAKSLLSEKQIIKPNVRWGWKEPNTHIVIDRLKKNIPNMKYIHVMRNGLDMAHSTNQRQLKLWGEHFIGSKVPVLPYYSLMYWRIVHQRISEICDSMGENFLLLNYDDFTLHSEKGVKELLQFLNVDVTGTQMNRLSNLIKPPESIGRFKRHGINIFDAFDVAFTKHSGFTTDME